jgi:hypothetical protein
MYLCVVNIVLQVLEFDLIMLQLMVEDLGLLSCLVYSITVMYIFLMFSFLPASIARLR